MISGALTEKIFAVGAIKRTNLFQCLWEIHRALKDDGVLAMLDMDGSGNVSKDMETLGASNVGRIYGYSLFSCLPGGSNSPGKFSFPSMVGSESL